METGGTSMPGAGDGSAVQYEVGDRISLKKGHPCGSNDWLVYRVGADIGLRCGGCDHRVMLPRRQVDRLVRAKLHEGVPGADTSTGSEG